ncbi:hypothetical protein VVD49_01040 [Uliginosibacterium sp. H3]|uniref:Uncharacterized protein n=1 Tax=Uliginosibacterium silvisoli TaxID=3114758 RepID=A0ABU6JZK4_9RHOO|nr:hypothetical protein [Uliginosibacterium sp. H3]
MDPVSIATAAVAVLSPYLAKAGEKIAGAAGDAAWKQAAALYDKLKRLPVAQAALDDLAKEPTDADTQAALRKELKKLLAEDDELMRELSATLVHTQAAGISFSNQITGDVGSINQIGTAGDVHIGSGKP